MNKIVAAVKISRPLNFLIAFASIVVAGLIASTIHSITTDVWFAALSGALIGAGGNIINDVFDVEIDKINRPKRILPSQLLSLRTAKVLYTLFNLTGIVLAIQINIAAVIIALTAIVIIFLYSYSLKRIPLAGNFVVSFFTGMAFIYGAVATGNWIAGIIPGVFAVMTNMIREIVKDMEDVAGDVSYSVITFPSKYGFDSSVKLIFVLTIILILLTTVPFVFHIYKIEYFVIVMPMVNGLFVYILKSLWNDQSEKNLRKTSNLIKLNMVIGLLAIYLGN